MNDNLIKGRLCALYNVTYTNTAKIAKFRKWVLIITKAH